MSRSYLPVFNTQCRFGRLELDDVPAIMEVERSGHAYPWSAAVMEDCFKQGYDCWGLWVDAELSGFAILAWQYDELHLLNLCIRRSHQRLGLGRRLLRYTIANAQSASARCILLEVRANNRAAIALYQYEGFAVIGWRKNYYPAGNGREDAQVMILPLIQGSP